MIVVQISGAIWALHSQNDQIKKSFLLTIISTLHPAKAAASASIDALTFAIAFWKNPYPYKKVDIRVIESYM